MEILRTEDLKKYYSVKTGIFGKTKTLRAVDGVSLFIESDSVFAIVGESGCGKSTLARLFLHLTEPTDGRVFFKNQDIYKLNKGTLKDFRRSVQVIFQDPFASLNPRMNIFAILSEPLKIHNIVYKRRLKEHVAGLLESVGLNPEHMERYPHEFSGGQRQRICIARALASSPELIVADEPLSSLDVSMQAQILNLLRDLKEKRRLSFVFISHDLNVIHYFADKVAVMYFGKIVEEAYAETIFHNPWHPYTERLLSAIPKVSTTKQRKTRIGGQKVTEVYPTTSPISDSLIYSLSGCLFYPRCPKRLSVCRDEEPQWKNTKGHKIACHLM